MVQTLHGHIQFNLGLASSLRTSPAAKILPSKRFDFLFIYFLVCFLHWFFSDWLSPSFIGFWLMQKVPFISEDLQLECEGKDKYKCGSNVFWKW